MKVIVIGAGFGGITAGIRHVMHTVSPLQRGYSHLGPRRFRQKIPNVELAIYEKGAGVGGTWYSNNYPCVALPSQYLAFCMAKLLVDRGLACDIPAHCVSSPLGVASQIC